VSGHLREDTKGVRQTGQLRPLLWSTAIAWASLALSLGLLWYQHRAGVLHPHSLLFPTLVSLTFASALFGLVYAPWSALRQPRSHLALACGVGSLSPASLWVLLGLYAIHELGKGKAPNNLCWKSCLCHRAR
jgi:hypothetical protein